MPNDMLFVTPAAFASASGHMITPQHPQAGAGVVGGEGPGVPASEAEPKLKGGAENPVPASGLPLKGGAENTPASEAEPKLKGGADNFSHDGETAADGRGCHANSKAPALPAAPAGKDAA